MNKEHSVIVVSGLGDETNMLGLATNHWKNHGLMPVIHTVGWRDGELFFQPKLLKLLGEIDRLSEKGDIVSLVGISAGGSAALNAFIERREVIHRVVNVCGRLRTGPKTGLRSFEAKTASSPPFAESVKLWERRESNLSTPDREKIMTVRAMYGDQLVPPETTILEGAFNAQIPTMEHMITIGMALTAYSHRVILFLKGP